MSNYGTSPLSIYLSDFLNTSEMTDYEWEARRVPPTPRTTPLGEQGFRADALSEYLALECPRESVGWLLRQPTKVARRRRPAVALRALVWAASRGREAGP